MALLWFIGCLPTGLERVAAAELLARTGAPSIWSPGQLLFALPASNLTVLRCMRTLERIVLVLASSFPLSPAPATPAAHSAHPFCSRACLFTGTPSEWRLQIFETLERMVCSIADDRWTKALGAWAVVQGNLCYPCSEKNSVHSSSRSSDWRAEPEDKQVAAEDQSPALAPEDECPASLAGIEDHRADIFLSEIGERVRPLARKESASFHVAVHSKRVRRQASVERGDIGSFIASLLEQVGARGDEPVNGSTQSQTEALADTVKNVPGVSECVTECKTMIGWRGVLCDGEFEFRVDVRPSRVWIGLEVHRRLQWQDIERKIPRSASSSASAPHPPEDDCSPKRGKSFEKGRTSLNPSIAFAMCWLLLSSNKSAMAEVTDISSNARTCRSVPACVRSSAQEHSTSSSALASTAHSSSCVLLDPMCGSGVIPLELGSFFVRDLGTGVTPSRVLHSLAASLHSLPTLSSASPPVVPHHPRCVLTCIAGDMSEAATSKTAHNTETGLSSLRSYGAALPSGLLPVVRLNCSHLPFRSYSIDGIVTDMPFGQRMGTHSKNAHTYRLFLAEFFRVLKRDARCVLLTAEEKLLLKELRAEGRDRRWRRHEHLRVNMGGLEVSLFVLSKRFSVSANAGKGTEQ
eukprot:TRINITY_DN6135_c3_g1_i1.p1 TRINITY_DN6135_c3_g1~~TRINITY_DN6135_c3_g1_i1.p1  ORF type:complete len:634 (+),score=85.99 TRINITY_DN6135_c3_g1_i1:78-1979(+)